ncbi:MAG: lysophospholipid acyltransferase family protein [Nocardioidaceae bacterium]
MRDITYPPIIVAVKCAFKAMGLNVEIDGSEHVPTTGGAVLALNHISYVDFIFGGFATQPAKRLVRFMAKRELFDHRLTGPLMRSLHHIEVDRAEGTASYRRALEYLRDGEVVGVFPEATISRSFELKEFKSGTVRLAARSGVPLIPLIAWGTQRIYTKDHPRDFSRGQTVLLTLGEPMHPTGAQPAQANEALRTEMSKLLDRTIRAYPEMPEGAWWLPRSYGGSAPSPEEALALDAAEQHRRAEERRATKRNRIQP